MLKTIHYARGLAALLVVMFHFSFMYLGKVEPYNTIFLNGGFGVDLFFLISGFIIAYVTKNTNTKVSHFFIKRFFRIYPLFFLILVVSCILLERYNVHPLRSMIKSGLLILQDYNRPAPEFDFNLIGPAWTLSYEIWFYFVFGISMLINHKHRILISSLLLMAQVFSLQYIFSGAISLNSSHVGAIGDSSYLDHIIKFFSTTLHLEFIAGMWIFILFDEVKIKINKKIALITAIILSLSSCVIYFSKLVYGSGLTQFYIIALPVFIALITTEYCFNVYNSRMLAFLGDISFSIYITHFFIMYTLLEHPPFFWSDSNNLTKLVFSTSMAIAFAFVMHKIVELPFIRVGKKLINRGP